MQPEQHLAGQLANTAEHIIGNILNVAVPDQQYCYKCYRCHVSFLSSTCHVPHLATPMPLTRACLNLKGKGKAEHLYSTLHGIQTTLKHSGMDHTVLLAINTMPAFIS